MKLSSEFGVGFDFANLATVFITQAAITYVETQPAPINFKQAVLHDADNLVLMSLSLEKKETVGFYKLIIGCSLVAPELYKVKLYSGSGRNVVTSVKPYMGRKSPQLQRRLIKDSD